MERDQATALAEGALLGLVRTDADDFTLTITRAGGRWTVSFAAHDAHGSGSARGRGETFADAWRRQVPAWARTERRD